MSDESEGNDDSLSVDELATELRAEVREALREELPSEVSRQVIAAFSSLPAPVVKNAEPKVVVQQIPAPIVHIDVEKLARAFADALKNAPKPEILFRETVNAPPTVLVNLNAEVIGRAIAQAFQASMKIEVKMPERGPVDVTFKFNEQGRITGARLTPA